MRLTKEQLSNLRADCEKAAKQDPSFPCVSTFLNLLDTIDELEIGHRRYEALKKLNGMDFYLLHSASLKGENFDAMVDELSKQ